MGEPGLAAGSLGRGRRAGDPEHGQRVRSFFHDKAGRNRHRLGTKPADRRGPRRNTDAGESPGDARMRGEVAAAALAPTANLSQYMDRLRISFRRKLPDVTGYLTGTRWRNV